MAHLLPDDALAAVLRRLPPRSIAACRAWRDAVDARRLLPSLDRLLPRRRPGGIFCNLCEVNSSQLVAHPSVRRSISGSIYHTSYRNEVADHCGGLLLLDDDGGSVANLATRQWAALPRRPPSLHMDIDKKRIKSSYYYRSYLVFDPAASPHYRVLSVPASWAYWDNRTDTSPHHLLVFSSRAWRWEETKFRHEGEVVVAGPPLLFVERYGVYWQDALYVYWHTEAITRVSLSSKKYQFIQLPPEAKEAANRFYLGKSDTTGVYCAFFRHTDTWRLFIWLLTETSCDRKMEWVLKHDSNLCPTPPRINCYYREQYDDEEFDGPWTLQEENYDVEHTSSVEVAEENQVDWDSDNDDILQTDDAAPATTYEILGFHPYKEVVFLEEGWGKGVAYHWTSSKYQYLGKLYTKWYIKYTWEIRTTASFTYTPCWIDLFRGEDYPYDTDSDLDYDTDSDLDA